MVTNRITDTAHGSLRVFLSCLFVLSFVLPNCGVYQNPEERVVITVGKKNVTVSDFKKDIRDFTAGMGIVDRKLGSSRNSILTNILEQYLILEYGREKDIKITGSELMVAIKEIKEDYPDNEFHEMLLNRYVDFEDWKERLRHHLLIKKICRKALEGVAPVTFQETKNYFEYHKEEFRHPELVRFSQIVTLKKEQAENALKRIRKGEDLSDLAREYSVAVQTEEGGFDGWVARGQLEESMEKAIFSLSVGELSSVVQTPYGYHIFKVLEKRPEGFTSLPEAMKGIEANLLLQKKELFYQRWLARLKVLYPVKINQKIMQTLMAS
ncbi:peptidyl-prolyl cis-trans isomerase [Thermodesulfobacteriota bacterium]